MNPSAYRDGQIIGYRKGFKLQRNEWMEEYSKTKWNEWEFESDLNESRFKKAYKEEYVG